MRHTIFSLSFKWKRTITPYFKYILLYHIPLTKHTAQKITFFFCFCDIMYICFMFISFFFCFIVDFGFYYLWLLTFVIIWFWDFRFYFYLYLYFSIEIYCLIYIFYLFIPFGMSTIRHTTTSCIDGLYFFNKILFRNSHKINTKFVVVALVRYIYI